MMSYEGLIRGTYVLHTKVNYVLISKVVSWTLDARKGSGFGEIV